MQDFAVDTCSLYLECRSSPNDTRGLPDGGNDGCGGGDGGGGDADNDNDASAPRRGRRRRRCEVEACFSFALVQARLRTPLVY